MNLYRYKPNMGTTTRIFTKQAFLLMRDYCLQGLVIECDMSLVEVCQYLGRVVEQHKMSREQWEERIVNWYSEHRSMLRSVVQ